MFHLSLPVDRYQECITFYRSCFNAEIVELTPTATNVFAFGAQITLHDDPSSLLTRQARKQLHFGPVVLTDEWIAIRDRLRAAGCHLLTCVEPDEVRGNRGKLVVTDPGGNLIEVNTQA